MEKHVKIKTKLHFETSATSFLPREFFEFEGKRLLGVQHPPFGEYEFAWDSDDIGRWNFRPNAQGVPLWTNIQNLRLFNSQSESIIDSDGILHNYWRNSGEGELFFTFSITEGDSIQWPPQISWYLYNAETGLEVKRGDYTPSKNSLITDVFKVSLGVLQEASYLLWAHISLAYAKYQLPPGYTPKGDYRYLEGEDEYIYDPYYNIGRIPGPLAGERGAALLALRESILKQNAQLDKPEWARYLVSSNPQKGDWSLTKIQVGSANFAINKTKNPSPTPALYRIEPSSYSGEHPVNTLEDVYGNLALPLPFDASARAVGASLHLEKDFKGIDGTVIIPKGKTLLGGSITTETGTIVALWLLNSDFSYKLLATNTDPSTGYCECAMLDHSATDIEQDIDGNIYVLSKCALYLYNPSGPTIEESFEPILAKNYGHPGGQCLRSIKEFLYFFTEFDGYGGNNIPGSETYYNYLLINKGNSQQKGPGTFAHVANCAERWMNYLWGVQQVTLASDLSIQYITWFDGWRWALSSGQASSNLIFPAEDYRWQRVRVMNECLFSFGKVTNSQLAICGKADGKKFKELSFPYRIRRLTPGKSSIEPSKQSLYAFGRNISTENEHISSLDSLPWSIIEVLDEGVNPYAECVNTPCLEFCIVNGETVDIAFEYLPNYLIWNGREYYYSDNKPTDNSFYLEKIEKEDGTVCYRVPPRLCWDESTYSFSISLDDIAFYGLGLSDFPNYLIWDNGCFHPSETAPTLIDGKPEFLEKVVEEERISYYLGDGVISVPFDTEIFNCILIGTLDWCPIKPPPHPQPSGFCWDDSTQSFILSKEDLANWFSITDYSQLPNFLEWNGTCWNPAETSTNPGRLNKIETEHYIFYRPQDVSLLPYDPETNNCSCGICSCLSLEDWCPTCEGECNVLYLDLYNDKVVRGKYENGEFVPCDPTNGSEACSTFDPLCKYQVIEYPIEDTEIFAVQVTDIMESQFLERNSKEKFNLWCRVDSTAPQDDLTTYRLSLDFNRIQFLPRRAVSKIEVLVLVPDGVSIEPPVISRRI